MTSILQVVPSLSAPAPTTEEPIARAMPARVLVNDDAFVPPVAAASSSVLIPSAAGGTMTPEGDISNSERGYETVDGGTFGGNYTDRSAALRTLESISGTDSGTKYDAATNTYSGGNPTVFGLPSNASVSDVKALTIANGLVANGDPAGTIAATSSTNTWLRANAVRELVKNFDNGMGGPGFGAKLYLRLAPSVQADIRAALLSSGWSDKLINEMLAPQSATAPLPAGRLEGNATAKDPAQQQAELDAAALRKVIPQPGSTVLLPDTTEGSPVVAFRSVPGDETTGASTTKAATTPATATPLAPAAPVRATLQESETTTAARTVPLMVNSAKMMPWIAAGAVGALLWWLSRQNH